MKILRSIRINATVQGRIWMPAALCSLDVSQTYTPKQQPFTREWNGLRSALLDISNQGDFQSCSIVDAGMEVEWYDPKARVTITKHVDLASKAGEETSDLFSEWMEED